MTTTTINNNNMFIDTAYTLKNPTCVPLWRSLLCGQSRCLYVDTKTLVLETIVLDKSTSSASGEFVRSSFAAKYGGVLALRIIVGTEQDLNERLHDEIKYSQLPGVIDQYAHKLVGKQQSGVRLTDLFASRSHYTEFRRTLREASDQPHLVTQIARKLSSSRYAAMITWNECMMGDLSMLQARTRVIMEPFLLRMFTKTFKEHAKILFKQYLRHDDLHARNVLFMWNPKTKEFTLKIADFGRCALTDDADDVQHSIERGVERIVSGSSRSKSPSWSKSPDSVTPGNTNAPPVPRKRQRCS